MLTTPGLAIVDFHCIDRLRHAPFLENGNRQPDRSFRALDAIAIAPPVLVELDVVVPDEGVRLPHLIEIAKPRQVAGLEHNERRQRPTPCIAKKSSVDNSRLPT